MMTVYLERRAINQLNRDSIYDTARYFMEEDSVVRLRREYLDTTVALSNKSSSNPNGWEQVEIRVKGAKKNV
jgi:hypothetical protein